MELQYNILWFEDEDRFVEPYQVRIGNYLDDLGGFVLNLTVEENADNLESLLSGNEFDLILVDWNLTSGKSKKKTSSKKLIQDIRDNGVYTQIIFYSGISAFREEEYELEGIYFADTDDDNLFMRIKEIIQNTLQRNLRVSITRGLFIASTIYLVEKLEDLLLKILKVHSTRLSFFQDYVVQSEFFNDAAKYRIIKDYLNLEIAELKQKIADTDNKEKIKLTEELKKIKGIKKKFNKFLEDILELRNDLAHAKPVSDQKNTLNIWIKKERCHKHVTFDLPKCKEIRKKFHAYEKNLDEISSLIDDST